MTPEELKQQVETIVLVMMENCSFDHVLGYLSAPEYGDRSDVDGMTELQDIRFLNPNSDGQGIAPYWIDDKPLASDLPHSVDAVATQLAHSTITKSYLMNGFVQAFEHEFHTSIPQPPVMGLLRPTSLPTTAALAEKYTVCDRWFASLPTSTAPNRLMAMCGYSDLRDTGSLVPNQTTVYDWLMDRGVSWRSYHAGLPFFTLMPRMVPLILTSHFRPFHELAEDLADEGPEDWPQVIFIEPDYYDSPIHFRGPCDNHPPLPISPGERFLAEIYQTLSSDPKRWARTLLIITYDEHGGWFDHVPPLPVRYRNPNGVAFETTGPRVPTLIVGPFAPTGVTHTALDHTSILQLIAERFGKPGEMYSPEVAARRDQGIASVSTVLSSSANNTRPRALARVRGAGLAPGALPPTPASLLRQGFEHAAKELAARHKTEAFAKFPELRDVVASPPTTIAVERVIRPRRKTAPKKKPARRPRRTGTKRKPATEAKPRTRPTAKPTTSKRRRTSGRRKRSRVK